MKILELLELLELILIFVFVFSAVIIFPLRLFHLLGLLLGALS